MTRVLNLKIRRPQRLISTCVVIRWPLIKGGAPIPGDMYLKQFLLEEFSSSVVCFGLVF